MGRRFVPLGGPPFGCLELSSTLLGRSLALRLQRLLHLILPGWRLRRLVDLALDLLSGREKPLLQLSTHGIGELMLQLVEDGLDGLANLLLELCSWSA